jgi:pantetheine-phosphate adenylyltransferase/16S rRNA (guanine(966)-N(2))-methyltransferase RsmD
MRVIAGSARGMRLAPVPPGVRPTSDRVRESLFNSLGQFFEGGNVLDLYAGTGALGIEALSRGCERAVFVEKSGRSVAAIRENLRRARFEEKAGVLRGDVERELDELARRGQVFHLIFMDPPYRIASTEVDGILSRLRGRLRQLLAPGGRLVVERGATGEKREPNERGVRRRYGGTVITILEREEITVNVAVCPGSFDPVTEGHVDIIRRASALFDRVVVAVGANRRKEPQTSALERARLIEKVTGDLANVSVEVMSGLLVDFAREREARIIVKGLRAVSDFESEFEQAQLNRRLAPGIETVFIMSSAEHSFLSSSAVREIAFLGGELRGLVPEGILSSVRAMYSGADARA